jgi:hypothetical protein
MTNPRKRNRAVSVRPKRDLVERLERELRRSRVSERVINTAMTAVRIILKAKERQQ